MARLRTLLFAVVPERTPTRAAHFVRRLARAFNARVHLVHVVPRWPEVWWSWSRRGADTAGAARKAARSALARYAAQTLPDLMPVLSLHVREGDAGREIRRLADEVGADLIVVGMRAHLEEAGGLGRTTRQLAAASSRPVVFVGEPVEAFCVP